MIKDVFGRRGASRVGVAFVGTLLSTTALASDLVISGAQTTPVATSSANGGPGNITVQSSGSVTVTAPAAVTVDSNNAVTNAGTIANNQETNASGILVSTSTAAGTARDITGSVTDGGTIKLPGPSATSTSLGSSTLNAGILVTGGGIFHGSIARTAGSTLTMSGNSSNGIWMAAGLDGSITNAGAMTIGGNGSNGILATGAVSGSVINSGSITAPGQLSIGIYTGGAVGGSVINQGTVSTGSAAGTDASGLATSALPGGHALWVANNAAGVLLEGNGVTKALEGNGIPAGAPADSSLTTTGGAEALYLGPGGSAGNHNITIGALPGDPSGASVILRGNVTSTSATSTYAVTAASIVGGTIGGINYQTVLTGGLLNSGGDISATSVDATATAMHIGTLAQVPSFVNRGDIVARSTDSSENATTGAPGGGGGDAYGLVIDAGGQVPSVYNAGHITAESHGGTQSAYAIIDNSGTLRSVVNDGVISATVKGTGSALAIDLSHGSLPVSVANTGGIVGDVLLGPGGDTFTSTNGALQGSLKTGAGDDRVSFTNTLVTGTIDLGDGANALTVNGGSVTGGIVFGNGAATADLRGTTLTIPTTTHVSLTSLHVGGGSTINFYVDAVAGTAGAIQAPAVTLDNDTTIKTTVTGAVHDHLTVDLIEASALSMNRDLSRFQPTSTVMYSEQVAFAAGNPNILQLQVTRHTASDLQLSKNLGAVYEAAISALATDGELSAKLGGFTDKSALTHALTEMLPDPGEGARIATLNAESLSQSAMRRRLDPIARDVDDPFGRFRSSYWAQTYTTYGSEGSQGELPGFYVISAGVAGGVDGELADNVLGGFSVSESLGFITENKTADRSIHTNTASLDFYARANADPLYIQGIVGAAYEGFSASRSVQIDDIARTTSSDWSGNHLHASADLGTTLTAGHVRFSPYLRGSYLRLFQNDHAESGGGDGLDLRYLSHTTTSLRAGGGLEATYDSDLGFLSHLKITAHGDYAHEFKTDVPLIQAKFAAGDTQFAIQEIAPSSYVITGGIGAALQRRYSTISLDYDAQSAGKYLGHTLTLTYRGRF